MKFVKIIYCSINHLALRNFRTICIYVQYLSENTLCLCIAFDHALNYPLLLAGFNFSIILNSECYICPFILHTIDKAHWNSLKKSWLSMKKMCLLNVPLSKKNSRCMFMENYKVAKHEMKKFIMKKKTKSWTLSEHPLWNHHPSRFSGKEIIPVCI